MAANAVALLAYCATSIGMTLLNKLIVGTLRFRLSFLSLFVQGVVVVTLLTVAQLLGLITFRPLRRDVARQWLPVTLLLCAMLFTGFKALEFISIPLFTLFKNLTIIAIAYGEYWIWSTPVTPMALASFALMVVSAVCGGVYDLEFTVVGYAWMFANCIASAAYVLYMRVVIKTVGFDDFDTVYYNNVLSLPVLLVLCMWDVGTLFTNSEAILPLMTSTLAAALVCSGVTSFLISYCSSWCLRVTSSTTYSMAGAVNKLPLAVAGMLFFNQQVTSASVLSVFAGIAAGLLYAYAKSQPSRMVSLGELGQAKARETPSA